MEVSMPRLRPATVCVDSDVVGDVQRRVEAAASRPRRRRHDVERQAAEITRLVRLAEQWAALDADRRRHQQLAPAARTSTAAGPADDTRRQRSDVIPVPVAVTTTPTAVATNSTSVSRPSRRRHDRGASSSSPRSALSQLVDVAAALQRCPKCHKVRLDATSRDTVKPPRSGGGNGRRSVRFKSASVTAAGHARVSETSPGKPTEAALGDKTTSSTFCALAPPRRVTISTVPCSGDTRQGQGPPGREVRASSGTVATPSDGDGRQDVNNNDDGDMSARGTWPRKPSPRNNTDLDAGHGARDVRPGLSTTQQVARVEQPTAAADSDVDDKSPSPASSYDPLDTVQDTADRR